MPEGRHISSDKPQVKKEPQGYFNPEVAARGPAIAQFLEKRDLCSRCQPIADNRILISNLCTACGADYLVKLVKMSHEGTFEIRKSAPLNRGMTSNQDISPMSIYQGDTYQNIRGYDPHSGSFIRVNQPIRPNGSPMQALRVVNPEQGKWKQVGGGIKPPIALIKRKARRQRRAATKRARTTLPSGEEEYHE
ncbi:hypothetical protein, partial [Acinetobacter indicus]|uniref:hypothetical protein n=1 Tax=Acinetobacter indicus TaxID=756892 RepID=UPI001C099F08